VVEMHKGGKKIRSMSDGDIILDVIVYFLAGLILLATAYPFIYVFSMSVSKPAAVISGEVRVLPVGFNLEAYKMIIRNHEIWNKLGNTVWIVVIGTVLSIIAAIIAAYPLSRKELQLRRFFMIVIIFTMFFSGGMIPNYLLIKSMGLLNSRWSLVLPSVASAWYIIIARTYFKTIPESLIESAKIDGCRHFSILFKIMVPLSLPIIAVIALYSAVGYWNAYFNAMIYITKSELQPLQLYLVKILVTNDTNRLMKDIQMLSAGQQLSYKEQLKYAIIMFTILPIIGFYPLLQKYFVKGVLVGSIKE
jgi:ABC-type sugar transport system, permease component